MTEKYYTHNNIIMGTRKNLFNCDQQKITREETWCGT